MPVGVITNVLSVVVGGVLGALIGNRLSDDFVQKLNMVFGTCAMAMGISMIILMEHMPAVVLAIILGTCLGIIIHLSELVNKGGHLMERGISKFVKGKPNVPREEFEAVLLTCIVLFCASGTGIYGAIISGMSGDHTILIAKSILDLFTALVFACTLGMVTAVVAIPQLVIFMILFMIGKPLYNWLDLANNAYIINDFKACGGILLLATGLRMSKIKMFPLADMLPAMVLIFPISILWENYVGPWVAALASL